MFSEVLRIKPQLDTAQAKQMEASLSQRFQRVAGRFKAGIMGVLKGTVAGISVGLLNKLLNPIEALEDKVKSLLGQGTDIRDLAEQFNTSPGEIKRLQDVAESFGVQPEQLKDMMLKYQAAIENARQELVSGQPISEQASAVKKFADEENIAKSFFQFMQSLGAEAKGQGRTVVNAAGQARQLTGTQSSQEFQKLVFGEKLFGAQRRLAESDFTKQLGKLNEPSANTLTQSVEKLAKLEDERRLQEIRNKTADFLAGTGNITPDVVNAMEAARAQQEKNQTDRLKNYEQIRTLSNDVEEAKKLLEGISTVALEIVGALRPLVKIMEGIKDTPFWRGLWKVRF